ncbi:LIM/homeobox protein Lhx2-like [Limulus polyphemus]|uniref:LIM/homeobox protein Lhx2-like n=1 Tax=Limulus polyphemus TaxID=6850 RepID=A0ABM1SVH9_LIMPO|nr:LIM/homeobox protein Lhx2-like [Limulus polyphemus]XP_022247635.1 LIM/homeobox protein Lhx2-like [Limulus polyphemus]XP_022247636.1 LIM/homeobox protein Lhx2-like [Limulus polyphemus]XP_022247637.1 LIM/homeobox protein Lhx2-like [Limulus polyphemus]
MLTVSSLEETTNRMAAVCAGCGGTIADRYYLLAVDRQWHVRCLKCCECKLTLDSELTCFSRDGNIYCREDYYRMFSVKLCARCHLVIASNELVMCAREFVYHLHCFTCATCNKSFTKGEYFGLKDNIIYCRLHYELLIHYTLPYSFSGNEISPVTRFQPGSNQTVYENVALDNNLCPSNSEELSLSRHMTIPESLVATHVPIKGKTKKRKGSNPVTNRGSTTNIDVGGMCGMVNLRDRPLGEFQHNTTPPFSPSKNISKTRPKRMRTSFKHHQMRTMKSYFAINHNPDAKDLKQLSQKTGLNKRVLQVWFQNARAKWRRNILHQHTQGPKVVEESQPLVEMTAEETLLNAL